MRTSCVFVRALASATILVSLLGCRFTFGNKSADVGPSADKQSYTYSYEQNGCKTGDHEFSSKEDYCKGLLDEGLNNGCAKSMRYEAYKSECGALPADVQGSSGGGSNNDNVDVTSKVDPVIQKALGVLVKSAGIKSGGEYHAYALKLMKDGTCDYSATRGFSAGIDPTAGTTVTTGWSASGASIKIVGVGTGVVSNENGKPVISLTVTEPYLLPTSGAVKLLAP
jgi:hypothetical protein